MSFGRLGALCSTLALLCAAVLPALAEDLPRVRAVYVETGPVIDGVLDDAVWEKAGVIDEFVQVVPVPGATPSQRTEVRLLRDAENLYVAIRAYEDSPAQIVAHRLERDDFFFFDDHVSMSIDPFRDLLNGYFFMVNPYGGRREVSFEGDLFEKEWDGIWYLETQIDEQGWTVEFALPFRSISFDPERDDWGINFGRALARNGEELRWQNPRLDMFMNDMVEAGILEGMRGAEQGIGLDLLPSLSVKRVDQPRIDHPEWEPPVDQDSRHYTRLEPSLDAFYKLTPSLTAALTLNTDFGETEVDVVQVNLSQYALFYPEKRDFFLQDSGIFEFAELNQSSLTLSTADPSVRANGLPFYSRRIGIQADGSEVGILAGAKLTGRVGRFKVGFLDVETDPSNDVGYRNLGVMRIAANVLEESTVGMIATRGNPDGNDSDALVGTDFMYRNSNFLPGRALIGTFWLQRSLNEGGGRDQWAYGGRIEYPNDHIKWKLGMRELQEDFDPKLGFVNRVGIRQYEAGFRYRTRTDGMIRTFDSEVDALLVTDLSNRIQSLTAEVTPLGLGTALRGLASARYIQRFERVEGPFEISPGVVIPTGSYHFQQGLLAIGGSPMRKFRPGFVLKGGRFYGGTLWSAQAGIEWRPTYQIFVRATYMENHVDLPQGDFITRLLEMRLDLHPSANLAWTNLIQYDNVSKAADINSRLRWIPVEGREIFLVLNQGFDARDGRLRNRRTEAIVKVGWLLRF